MTALAVAGRAAGVGDAWLEVTGQLVKDGKGKFVVAAESMKPTRTPSNPYLTSGGF